MLVVGGTGGNTPAALSLSIKERGLVVSAPVVGGAAAAELDAGGYCGCTFCRGGD